MSSYLPSDYSTPAKKVMGGVETVSNTHFIFPVLKNGEILQCMAELGIDLSKVELSEPHRHKEKVRKVFWQLLEVCRGTTEEDLQKKVPVHCLEQLGVPPAEQELHEDNLVDLLFFQEMRQCMKTCGIIDFSWKDLHYPTAKRFRCQLSATINMAKFREEQLKIYSELNEPRHQLLLTLEELHAENAQLQEQLDQTLAESNLKMEEYDMVAKECQELESEIARSNKLQASKREEASQLKKHNNATKDELAAATWNLQESQAEEEGLAGKLVSSPDRRKRELESKREILDREKAETRRLQQEISDGKAKMARVQQAIKDIEATMGVQQQVLDEASKYEETKRQVDETAKEIDMNREKTSELQEKTDEADRSYLRLEEKLLHLRKQARMKMEAVQDRLDIAKDQLLIVEKDRRESNARIEAGEAEVRSLEAQMKAEQAKTDGEIVAMIAEYNELEQVFMKRNEKRMLAIEAAM